MISRDVYQVFRGWIAALESYLNTLVEPGTEPGKEQSLVIQDPNYRRILAKLEDLELRLDRVETLLLEARVQAAKTPKTHWWNFNRPNQPAALE